MHMFRTRIASNIICEFLPPAKPQKVQKIIIFAMGLPSSPSKSTLAEFYSEKGFWFFFPRYRGTWESGGEFLEEEPTKDISDCINSLFEGFTSIPSTAKEKSKKYIFKAKSTQVNIMGSSFGGPASILLTSDKRVNKIICNSPVVDWSGLGPDETHEFLNDYIKSAFGEAFRYTDQNYNKLAKGFFYNPITRLSEIDGSKILIFHSKDDRVVKYAPVKKFAEKTKSKLITLSKYGHGTGAVSLEPKHWKIIKNWLK